MTETPSLPAPPERRPLLEIAGFVTLAALAFAAVVGVIAVLDTDSRPAGFGVGIGIAALIFFAGATIACALACLVRRRLELVALVAVVAACVTIDLVVLAAWLDIDHEVYVKTAGVAFVWSFFGLVVLALALAVVAPVRLARALYTGAFTSAVVAAAVATWLVLTSDEGGGGSEVTLEEGVTVTESSTVGFAGPVTEDDVLLQVLGVMLVLLAAFWFGALAASRLPDQTLKRTFTTSPSSTT